MWRNLKLSTDQQITMTVKQNTIYIQLLNYNNSLLLRKVDFLPLKSFFTRMSPRLKEENIDEIKETGEFFMKILYTYIYLDT
jgi:hypothetical protein